MSRPTPTKERLAQVIQAAGTQGMATKDLVQSLKDLGVQMKPKSWEMMLLRAKQEGRIFGKGAYMPGVHGITYRYFGRQDWCDEYVFEGALDPQQREERAREMSRLRGERRRKTHPKPRKQPRVGLTHEELKARDREYRKELRARKRSERIAAGEVLRSWLGTSERTIRRKKERIPKPPKVSRTARPGSELLARDDRVPAPVAVRKRELIGEPIITSATKVTIAPVGIDYRYHVDPESVKPVFSALRPGILLEGELV